MKALVLGAGGFIGSHMVKKLKSEGYWVRGVDLKYPEFSDTHADDFIIYDLTEQNKINEILTIEDTYFDEIYQFAADMGGAGFIFTGENDSDIMYNSASINLNILKGLVSQKMNSKILYSSSACIYPEENQQDPENPNCVESSAYPANPDSEYGWEKIFSERLYNAFNKNYGIDIRVARYHNIYGPEGTWDGGKEKAPAAMCRKVAQAKDGDSIEVWGDGKQTRSFLYIDECVKATRKLMDSDYIGPVNIGSEEMITINDLAQMTINISEKNVTINNVDGPLGVRGRNSDNTEYRNQFGWEPGKDICLHDGMVMTYAWIEKQVKQKWK